MKFVGNLKQNTLKNRNEYRYKNINKSLLEYEFSCEIFWKTNFTLI